ncbi:MAG: hypothetical protein LBP56_01360 [Odoribacteraceae bacterium]|jgi:hypothetical protein|nr:hypothetical protein [Odoribacteraceae bacterium]
MKTLFKILSCGLLLAATLPASAQWEPRYTVAWQPFYAINGTARFDFEARIKERKWLQASLFAHAVTNKEDEEWVFLSGGEDLSRLRGMGLGLAYKYFFHRWFYGSAGITYNNYRVRYTDDVIRSYREDGLTFHEYLTDQEVQQHFDKFSTSWTIGLQSTLRHVFFVDLFVGLGYAYSFYDEAKKPYDDGPFSFGHCGLFPTGGLRFGFAF